MAARDQPPDALARTPPGAEVDPEWAHSSTLERPAAPPTEDQPGGPQLKALILGRLFADAAGPPKIGRFALLKLLGEGGMGVVWAAYDELLDRKVAIKLLRAESTPRRELQRARMLREAKLTAQLQHANVITVHEVGEHEGQIFIAMEFIRGESLDAWLARTGAVDWRAVVAAFAQAGAGLVAAHRAGLVHRDFKPANVMMGEDGIVKVLDFGLARESLDDSRRSDERADAEPARPPISAPLTQTGTIMGTPAYMAPEQHLGQPADERSDQFSFCVALWEALHRQHPFAGGTLFALRASVLAGRLREPPAGSPVPARLRRLLARGLSVRPEDRHPSLAGLLAELARDPAAARRRWLAVGGLVLATSAGSYALATRHANEAAPCSGVADELADAWNDARRDAVAAAIRATGVPYGEDTLARVTPALDAYARDWTAMRAESCQAHADALESDRLYDLRTACLARRRTAVHTLVDLLAQATAADVENAARAVAGLPGLAPCADTEALAAAVPPPEDPAVARAVEAHRGELARAREYEALGRYAEARAVIEPTLASPEAAGYAPLEAEAALALGTVELSAARNEVATEALTRALVAGLRAAHLDVAAEAFARRIFTLAQSGAAAEALRDEPPARALVERASDFQLEWLLSNNVGVAYIVQHRFAEARERLLAALATRERAGRADFETAATLVNLGNAAMALGDIAGARESLERALTTLEQALGPGHPAIAMILFNLARSEHYSGRLGAARTRMRAAIDMMARNYGPDAGILFDGYLQLAALSNDREAFADTLDALDRLAPVRAAHDLADHPHLLYGYIHRAIALAGLGRHAEAEAELSAARTVAEARRNPLHDPAEVHDARGQIALRRGDVDAAIAAFREAAALRDAAGDRDSLLRVLGDARLATALDRAGQEGEADALANAAPARFLASSPRSSVWYHAELRLRLGDILLAAGRPAEALQHYETGRSELAALSEPDDARLALLQFGVARALLRVSPAEVARAGALARIARAALAAHAPGFAAELAALDRALRDDFATSPPPGN